MRSVSSESSHDRNQSSRSFFQSLLGLFTLILFGSVSLVAGTRNAFAAPGGWSFGDTLGVSIPFNGLSFVNPSEGWITGASGVIVHTSDAGKTWVAQTSGTTHWLQSVSFVDSSHGWIAGNNGTILTTSDGGQTWTPQDSGVKFDLYTVTFLNAQEGWVGGFAGTLLHTTNGGETWIRVSTDSAQWIMNIFFLKSNAKYGWAVGQDGLVLATKDGGQTWEKKNNSIAKDLYGVFFTDANNGWAVGTHGVIQFTANGGDTWTIQNGLGRGLMGRGVEGDERELNDLHAVAFLDAKTGYAVGVMGMVLKTVDGGNHWTFVKSGTGLDLYNVAFPVPDAGWIVGVGGMILHKGKS